MPSHQERPPTMKPSKNKSWQDVVSLPLTRQQSSTSGLISPEPTLEPGLMPCSVSQNAGCNPSGSPWLKLWSLSHPLTPEQPDPATGGDDHSRARHRFRSPTVPRGKMTPKVSHSLSWILCPLFSTRLPMRATLGMNRKRMTTRNTAGARCYKQRARTKDPTWCCPCPIF